MKLSIPMNPIRGNTLLLHRTHVNGGILVTELLNGATNYLREKNSPAEKRNVLSRFYTRNSSSILLFLCNKTD